MQAVEIEDIQEIEEIEALPLPLEPEDQLQLPRGADRRLVRQAEPPWLTDEGIVMEDRRSGQDRRS